jgi:hypothetical protein
MRNIGDEMFAFSYPTNLFNAWDEHKSFVEKELAR